MFERKASLAYTPVWNPHSGGKIYNISGRLPRFDSYSSRHVYWNGGYFGSIYQVKAILPKPKVCHLLPSRQAIKLISFSSMVEFSKRTPQQLHLGCCRWNRRYNSEYTVSCMTIHLFQLLTFIRFDVCPFLSNSIPSLTSVV